MDKLILKVGHTNMSSSDDPVLENIRQAMRVWFFPRSRLNKFSVIYNDDNQNVIISRKMEDGMFTVHLLYNKSSVRLNGVAVSKENAEHIMSKIINRLCFEKSSVTMKEYVNMLLTVRCFSLQHYCPSLVLFCFLGICHLL